MYICVLKEEKLQTDETATETKRWKVYCGFSSPGCSRTHKSRGWGGGGGGQGDRAAACPVHIPKQAPKPIFVVVKWKVGTFKTCTYVQQKYNGYGQQLDWLHSLMWRWGYVVYPSNKQRL